MKTSVPNQHDVYFFQYLSKIVNSVNISYTTLQPGMVIDLTYRKERSEGGSMIGRYMVLVLSTKQHPTQPGRFIYGLSLEHIRPGNFTRLVNLMGLDEMSAKLYHAKRVAYPRVLIPEGASPQTIYNKFIKPKLPRLLNESYRLFKKERIVRVAAVDFEWSKILVQKYLIENKPNVNGINPSDV